MGNFGIDLGDVEVDGLRLGLGMAGQSALDGLLTDTPLTSSLATQNRHVAIWHA
jgi:hypothetical protein